MKIKLLIAFALGFLAHLTLITAIEIHQERKYVQAQMEMMREMHTIQKFIQGLPQNQQAPKKLGSCS